MVLVSTSAFYSCMKCLKKQLYYHIIDLYINIFISVLLLTSFVLHVFDLKHTKIRLGATVQLPLDYYQCKEDFHVYSFSFCKYNTIIFNKKEKLNNIDVC